MKPLLSCLLILTTCIARAQHYEMYYDFKWNRCEAMQARFLTELIKKDSLWERKDFYIHERSLQMHGFYTDTSCKIAEGAFTYYYANKALQSYGNYNNGKKDGLWLDYYDNGMLKDSAVYSKGNITGTSYSWHSNGYPWDSAVWNADGSGMEIIWFDNGNPAAAGRYSAGHQKHGRWQYFHKNGKPSDIELYNDGVLKDKQYFDENGNSLADTTNKDHAAIFPGGMDAWKKYLSKRIYFPRQYKFDNTDKAVVVISAMIDEEGNMTNVTVTAPLYPAFDDIAVKAFKSSPKWQPAVQYNRHVSYSFSQAVYFTQEEY